MVQLRLVNSSPVCVTVLERIRGHSPLWHYIIKLINSCCIPISNFSVSWISPSCDCTSSISYPTYRQKSIVQRIRTSKGQVFHQCAQILGKDKIRRHLGCLFVS